MYGDIMKSRTKEKRKQRKEGNKMKINKMNMIIGYPEGCVIEQTTKIAEKFESMGFEVIANMAMIKTKRDEWGIRDYYIIKGSKRIIIGTVYRSNGTTNNVSTYLDLHETPHGENIDGYCGILHRVDKVKITKDSGERAINNKINRILEQF